MSFHTAYRAKSSDFALSSTPVNQVHCGDAAEVLAGFNSGIADLVITDPPYICGYKDRHGRTVANDRNADRVMPVFGEVYRVLKPDSYCISFYGWTAIAEFTAAWKDAGFRVVGQIVWPKQYTSSTGFMQYQHEAAFVLAKGRPDRPNNPIPDVQPWHYTGNRHHPTEKSIDIIKPLIEAFSQRGDVILDPFLGSGTTALAAALSGRRYIGVELEQKHCARARQRLDAI
ncbi:DNA methyltransferase [Salaquimonas pukyongi]|uniref:DNA methyltransferase n=1 Tax=Salaquimonas pukyongi TaxID=2712698 RepID=UPI001967C5E7|nr:DNA methyltransferase [Salaquimonas pukyongi]